MTDFHSVQLCVRCVWHRFRVLDAQVQHCYFNQTLAISCGLNEILSIFAHHKMRRHLAQSKIETIIVNGYLKRHEMWRRIISEF